MKLDYFEYNIAEHWVCALENGDIDSLSEQEQGQLEEFEGALQRNAMGWEWGEESFFAVDEVSGLHAQCIKAKLYFPKR